MLTMISEFVLSAGSIGREIVERLAVGERVRGSPGHAAGEGDSGLPDHSAEARDLALEASPLYELLTESAREGFTGTLAELRARLDSMVSEALRRSVRWPKAPNALSNAIRRMATNVRAAGIEFQFSRNDEQGRHIISVLGAGQVRENIVSHLQ